VLFEALRLLDGLHAGRTGNELVVAA
jgi:hypothetical protein